jgi:CP family cyanate transporter-like MFS transporter
MSEHRPLPLWAGRAAALLGIVLVAFTLRQAVAAMGARPRAHPGGNPL